MICIMISVVKSCLLSLWQFKPFWYILRYIWNACKGVNAEIFLGMSLNMISKNVAGDLCCIMCTAIYLYLVILLELVIADSSLSAIFISCVLHEDACLYVHHLYSCICSYIDSPEI